MMLIILFTILLMIIHINICAINEANAFSFLKKYGYLKFHSRKSLKFSTDTILEKGILNFQTSTGLNKSGHLDNQTLNVMNLPRCGVTESATKRKMLKFATHGQRWNFRTIYYNIRNHPTYLPEEQVNEAIDKAFSMWSTYANIEFIRTIGNAHIDIGFYSGNHGDGDPFDGPGGTVAHAYFPRYGGDVHFDNSEWWAIKNMSENYQNVDLLQTATHEIGHALGLGHSNYRSAVMYPFYLYRQNFHLGDDDIDGIQYLYKEKETINLCKNSKIDTLLRNTDGNTYVFQGDWYWKLIEQENYLRTLSKPEKISSKWPGLPGSIDAAFSSFSGMTYFFKNDRYWVYVGQTLLRNYPKLISDRFDRIPNDLDTVIFDKTNYVILFFKGRYYWRHYLYDGFTSNRLNMLERGMPTNLDASLPSIWENVHYIFKGDGYYKINLNRQYVLQDNPIRSYPKSIIHDWFGCKYSPFIYIQTHEYLKNKNQR